MATTFEELLEQFNFYKRTGSESVIIHPGLPNGFIELKEDFVQKLKADLKMKAQMCAAGIDELDPTTKFAIMILSNSY